MTDTSDDERRTTGSFERRIQSVVQLIISALLVWVGFTVVDMGKSIIRLEERGLQTTTAISEMKVSNAELKVQVTAAALAASNAATAAALVATASAAQQRNAPKQ